jgi:hypothetical protein
MTKLEKLEKDVVDTKAAYAAACDAVHAALLACSLVPDDTYATADAAADALSIAQIALSNYLKESDLCTT